ncbi:MAG: hypothetical protein JSV92_03235 [archaeon]|nr:MAG: hypothetical protein JSV92_03235 [archaeon]
MNIDNLIKDVEDDFWRNKIKRSVNTVLRMYGLSLDGISVSRQKINPAELYITAVDECNLEEAREISRKYEKLPPPVTVIQHRHKKVLFLGSNRSVIFVLNRRFPDCILIRLPNNVLPKIVSEAKLTLKEVIDRQKAKEK